MIYIKNIFEEKKKCLRGKRASQVVQVIKQTPANAGGPGLGRSSGGGHGNPLKHSCLENPMERRAWWATVHNILKSQRQLK